MTHPIYSQTNLEALTTAQLKTIANQIGAIPDGDKRVKQVWVSAIINHQIVFSPTKVAAMKLHVEQTMERITTAAAVKVEAVEEVPTDLIEELTLDLLGIEVIDRDTQTDEVIPHGYPRYLIHKGDELLGSISTWVDGGYVLTSGKSYSSLFEAVTSINFVSRGELALAHSDAQSQLRERFADQLLSYI